MTTSLGQGMVRMAARGCLAAALAWLLSCHVLPAQPQMEDLPRTAQVESQSGGTQGSPVAAQTASSSEEPGTDGAVTLQQLGLPADALAQSERRLPTPEQRAARLASTAMPRAALITPRADSTPVVVRLTEIPSDPWTQAQQAAQLLGSVLAANDSSDSSRPRLEELARDLSTALEAAAGGELAAKQPKLAKLKDELRRQLDGYFATTYGKLSYFSPDRYSKMWQRHELRASLATAIQSLDTEIRVARAAGTPASTANRGLSAPVSIRFSERLGAGLKAGELPVVTVRSPSSKTRQVRAYPDGGGYSIRVLSSEKGHWTASVSGGEEVPFEAEAGGGGLVRVDPASPHTFTRADGRRLVPVGMNLGWVLEGNSTDERLESWRRYLDRIAGSGQNWIRVWCCPWSMCIESKQTGVGRYDPVAAAALDRVFEMAAQRGLYVQLTIEYHGMLRSKNDWPNNPYNAANGGPCNKPGEFFSSAAARRLFKRRLDYLVARYSGHENLFAWELWNEVDLTLCNPVNVLRWHEEMAAYLKQIDPFGHLVTSSTSGGHLLYAPLWMQHDLDFAQVHCYRHDLAVSLPAWVDKIDHFKKPAMAGEAGQDSAWEPFIWETRYDPAAIGLHDALFSGLACGAAGSGMFWWWDKYIDASNHYDVFKPASRLAAWMEAMSGEVKKAPASAGGAGDVRAVGVRSPGRALVWLNDRNYVPTDKVPNPPATSRGPVWVELEVGSSGSWEVTRFDTWTGQQSPAGTVSASGQTLRFQASAFQKDVAYLLVRK
ncbi:MAG: cellulase family glycosylhydrolase [Candidatus Wallbacteria bacterium]|nr:cellulase family glycosylhydrolase [Candidatus Wallbacteria bacterium]